jgi:SAM-dependent methyltransferase
MTDFDHREASAHYDELLAPVYAWMVGDLRLARDAAARDLERLGVSAPTTAKRALDLGAGLGVHAVPLGEQGYAVTAIDTSRELLAEFARARADVTLIRGDIAGARELTAGPFHVVLCIGDTLPHLGSLGAVHALFQSARQLLAPDGKLILTWRDHTQAPVGSRRFILVRGDADRILTCALDYSTSTVQVTDILHERGPQGWRLRTSAYHKMRLASPTSRERSRQRALRCRSARSSADGSRSWPHQPDGAACRSSVERAPILGRRPTEGGSTRRANHGVQFCPMFGLLRARIVAVPRRASETSSSACTVS